MDEQSVSLEPVQAAWLLSTFGVLFEKAIDAEVLKRECAHQVALHDIEKIAGDLVHSW